MNDWEELLQLESDQLQNPAFSFLSERYVAGEGADDPHVFIIGEAPGAQEDVAGRPFAGKSGVVLRDLMLSVCLSTEDWQNEEVRRYGVANAWLTNAVKFRPPRNRNPFPSEIEAARPYLRREWEAVGRPQVIIPVGAIAFQAITGKYQSILMAAGKCHNYKNREGLDLFIWPMVHPAFGLRNKAAIPLLEEDWRRLGEWLKAHDQEHG